MDRYKAPRDKLLCLVNVKTMVENIVQLAAQGGAAIGGEPRCCAPPPTVFAAGVAGLPSPSWGGAEM